MINVPDQIVSVVDAAGVVLGIGEASRVRSVKKNEFPFVGRFRGPGENPSSCTGSMLNENIVLSAGHCVQELGNNPLFILNRDPHATDGAASATLLQKGDDWALYRLQSKISYDGPYPNLRVMSAENLKDKRLIGIGFPVEGSDTHINQFFADENCRIINTTFVEKKFLSNCFTRKGMSGGPLGFFENGEFSIVAIRQGPQWGALRKAFGQLGTVETPTSVFKNSYENLANEPNTKP